jgi:hypothetical protein
MPHKHASRKELARALSQLVLARESIMVYAATALRQPELVETPALASALGLWLAVLERAEKESDTGVETLVAVVLEDNPAADDLQAAFEAWRKQTTRSEASLGPPCADAAGAGHAHATLSSQCTLGCPTLGYHSTLDCQSRLGSESSPDWQSTLVRDASLVSGASAGGGTGPASRRRISEMSRWVVFILGLAVIVWEMVSVGP